MKKALILAAVLACSLPAFAFNATQTTDQQQTEFTSRLAAISPEDSAALAALVSEARLAGLTVESIAGALAASGRSNAAITAALQAGGFSSSAATNAVAILTRTNQFVQGNTGGSNFLGNNAGSNGGGGSGSSASPH